MRMTAVLSAIVTFTLLTASGCGGGSAADAAAAGIGVQVEPPTPLAPPSGTVAFRATVTGTAATAVTWTADCGSITQAGVFTAPQTTGTCRVTASAVGGATGSALVTVGAGGWAATCAAEPEPTSNIVYACDCAAGADAGCAAGNDANTGTSKSAPIRSWSAIQAAWRALPAGGTIALCRGGRWASPLSSGWMTWRNMNCSSASPCTLRDYAPGWGSSSAPVLAASGNDNPFRIGGGTPANDGYRFLNIRIVNVDGGVTAASKDSTGFTILGETNRVDICNLTVDGFGIGIYVSQSGTCATTNVRGSRVINNCIHGMLVGLKDSDIDGNYFDNNGHSLCGGYNLANPSGGTTHTIYLDGRACPETNVRVINNEVHRSGMFQGDLTTVQSYVAGTGWVRTGGAWYDQSYPQGSPFTSAASLVNVTWENNLIDMTPVHPAMDGGAIFGGNDGGGATSLGFDGIVVRRNRILAGRGRQIGLSSVIHGVIEDNAIVVSVPTGLDIIAIPHGAGTVQQTSAAVRNNTIYFSGAAPADISGIRVAGPSATTGNIVTGNSVTFAAGGGTCFRADTPSKVAFMDNNQCAGASSYATNGASSYSIDGWRAAAGFDANSTTAAASFVNAPTDLTPASGDTVLTGKASTLSTCTVLGVANQPCTSPTAIGSPIWSPLDGGAARATPSIGAFNR